MGTLGAIIGTIIFGAVIGMLARLALPGKQQVSALLTVALGVAGGGGMGGPGGAGRVHGAPAAGPEVEAAATDDGLDLLTPREREVLRLVAEGHSNRAIAVAAHIEEATVKAHLTRIFTKLDVNSRTSAVATARAAGII